ncbi:methylamine dehydrogenase accessory protein MauD [Skermanella aerolata]|uniref:methylamine dehydrogenase accessory protein MauD n=1 Tax=Skermanella aerolata TaxID=393310 RepID=UPI003D192F10
MTETLFISQILLWIAVIGLSLLVLALARQVGVLHERIAPMGALMTDKGASVGEPAPVLKVADRTGQILTLGGSNPMGRGMFLLFVSPTCPICKKLLPFAKHFARSERRSLDLVLVGDGEASDQERMIRDYHLEEIPYLVSTEVGMTYKVGKLPYAVLIGSDGIVRAKGLVNSREHLESLITADELGFASIQDYVSSYKPATVASPVIATSGASSSVGR